MGRVDVDAMLEELSPHQFDEWVAYHELEAWGDQHRQNAMFMATVMNSQGGKKGGGAFQADDFLPKYITPEAAEAEAQRQQLAGWKQFAALGGAVRIVKTDE